METTEKKRNEIGDLAQSSMRAVDNRGSSVKPKDNRVITNQELYAPTYQAIGGMVKAAPQALAQAYPLTAQALVGGGAEAQAMYDKGNVAGAIGRSAGAGMDGIMRFGMDTLNSAGQAIGSGLSNSGQWMANTAAPVVNAASRFVGGMAGMDTQGINVGQPAAPAQATPVPGQAMTTGAQPNFANVQAGASSKAMAVPTAGANEAAMRAQESNVNAVAAGYQPPMVQGIAAPRPASTPAMGRPFEFNGQTGYEVTHPGYTTGETRDIPAATMQAVNQGIATRKDGGDQGFDARMIQQGIAIGRTTGKDGSVSFSDQTNRYANTDFGKQQISASKDAESKRMKDVIQERSDRQTAMALDGVYGQKAREQAIAQTQNAQASQIQTDAAALSLKQAQDINAMRVELAKAMDTGDEAGAKKIVAKINALSGGKQQGKRIPVYSKTKTLDGDSEQFAGSFDEATGAFVPYNQGGAAGANTVTKDDAMKFKAETKMTDTQLAEHFKKYGITVAN